jgi:hypothetical protein
MPTERRLYAQLPACQAMSWSGTSCCTLPSRPTTKFADECARGSSSHETVPRNEPSVTWMMMNRIALSGRSAWV